MVCERPKCYRTKADKCMNPNSWILFLQRNAGKGLTRSQLKTQYKAWKSTRFPSNSTVTSRRNLLCDDITSSPLPIHSKKTITKRPRPSRIGLVQWRKPEYKEMMDGMKKRLAGLVKEDTKRVREENRIIRAAKTKKNRQNRSTILLNARIAKALSEKKKEEARSKKALIKISKFISIQRKRAKGNAEKKKALKKIRKALDYMTVRMRIAQAKLNSQPTIQPVTDVSPSSVNSVMVVEQITSELTTVRLAQEALMGCKIPDSYGSGMVGSGSNSLFKDGPSFQNTDSCSYIQKLFNMGEVRPTVLFVKPSPVFSIYEGVYKTKSVFIKVSSIKTGYDQQQYENRIHIQKTVSKIFKDDSSVHISEMVGTDMIRVGKDESTGIDSVGSFEAVITVPGKTISDLMRSGSIGDETRIDILRRLAKLLRAMHDKLVFHGDAHLQNFIYDADKKRVYPIDLERTLIYKTGDKDIARAKSNDFSTCFYSIQRAFLSEELYLSMMEEFCSSYYSVVARRPNGRYKFKAGENNFATYNRLTPVDQFMKVMRPLMNNQVRERGYTPLFKYN